MAKAPPTQRASSSVTERLRAARLARELSQAVLANKAGLRQHHLSNIERAAVDPRLSTVLDLARALDLEVMLVPRQLIPAVEALQSSDRRPSNERPMYTLDEGGGGELA